MLYQNRAHVGVLATKYAELFKMDTYGSNYNAFMKQDFSRAIQLRPQPSSSIVKYCYQQMLD